MARFSLLSSQAVWAACTAVLVTGCAQPEKPSSSGLTASDAPARHRLKVHMNPAANAPASSAATAHRYKFRQLLSDEADGENRPAAPGAKPNGPWGGYDPQRLAKVAQVHEWWPVDGPESGFQIHLKSQWKEGRLIINVLIVGPVVNINRFLGSIKTVQVIILDADGNNLANWGLAPSDFEWASNDGSSAVLVYKTQVDFPLDVYERFNSWNFLWTNP